MILIRDKDDKYGVLATNWGGARVGEACKGSRSWRGGLPANDIEWRSSESQFGHGRLMEGKDSTLEGFAFSAEAAKINLNRCTSSNLLASLAHFCTNQLALIAVPCLALSFFHSIVHTLSAVFLL